MAETPATIATLPVDNLRGAIWMLGASIIFAGVQALVKYAAEDVPPAEMVFFRCLFGLTVVAPLIMRNGLRIFRTQRPGLHVTRIVAASAGMNLGFYATAHMPLATVVSLGYTRPLFMIVLGAVFLGESVGWRRGLATLAGFVGVLVVVGPTEFGSLPAALAALGGAFCAAVALAVVRNQAAVDGAATVLVWFATGTVVATALPALAVWETPTATSTWLLMVLLGIASTVGQFCIIKALAVGEATVMNPVDYSQILLTALLGYAIFSEVPTAHTWIGAAIIVASTLYILLRDARVKQGQA